MATDLLHLNKYINRQGTQVLKGINHDNNDYFHVLSVFDRCFNSSNSTHTNGAASQDTTGNQQGLLRLRFSINAWMVSVSEWLACDITDTAWEPCHILATQSGHVQTSLDIASQSWTAMLGNPRMASSALSDRALHKHCTSTIGYSAHVGKRC